MRPTRRRPLVGAWLAIPTAIMIAAGTQLAGANERTWRVERVRIQVGSLSLAELSVTRRTCELLQADRRAANVPASIEWRGSFLSAAEAAAIPLLSDRGNPTIVYHLISGDGQRTWEVDALIPKETLRPGAVLDSAPFKDFFESCDPSAVPADAWVEPFAFLTTAQRAAVVQVLGEWIAWSPKGNFVCDVANVGGRCVAELERAMRQCRVNLASCGTLFQFWRAIPPRPRQSTEHPSPDSAE